MIRPTDVGSINIKNFWTAYFRDVAYRGQIELVDFNYRMQITGVKTSLCLRVRAELENRKWNRKMKPDVEFWSFGVRWC